MMSSAAPYARERPYLSWYDCEKADCEPCGGTFGNPSPDLLWKATSPIPDTFLMSCIPMEKPIAARESRSASFKAKRMKSLQNVFEKTAFPILTIKPETALHVRTTKFALTGPGGTPGVKGLSNPPRYVSCCLTVSACIRNSPGVASALCGVENGSAANSAFVDKAYLPGIKPIVARTRKEKVLFRGNSNNLCVDHPFKIELLNAPQEAYNNSYAKF